MEWETTSLHLKVIPGQRRQNYFICSKRGLKYNNNFMGRYYSVNCFFVSKGHTYNYCPNKTNLKDIKSYGKTKTSQQNKERFIRKNQLHLPVKEFRHFLPAEGTHTTTLSDAQWQLAVNIFTEDVAREQICKWRSIRVPLFQTKFPWWLFPLATRQYLECNPQTTVTIRDRLSD